MKTYPARLMPQGLVFQVALILLIACVVFYANWHGIFVYESLYLDDLSRYGLAKENKLHSDILQRNFLRAYVMYVAYELLTLDLWLGRFYMACWLVLACYLTYRLLKKFQLPCWLSFFCSITPAVFISKQLQIPSFVDGSYVVPGTCVALLCFLLATSFVKRPSFFSGLSVFILYIVSIEMMDQAIFLAPALIFLVLLFPVQQGREVEQASGLKFKLTLVCAILLAATAKAATILYKPVGSYVKPKELSAQDIKSRVIESVEYVLPINYDGGLTSNLFVIVALSLFLAVPLFSLTFGSSNRSKTTLFTTIFCLIWVLPSCLIFWVSSPYFSARYFYVGSLFSAVMMGVGINWIVSVFKTKAISVLMILISVSWGAAKIYEKREISEQHFETLNRNHHRVQDALSSVVSFPDEAQIAVDGYVGVPTGGYWSYSSRYLQILLKRDDVAGFIGSRRLQFYNAFLPSQRGYKSQMTGLDRSKPVFIFYLNRDGSNQQMKYALVWYASKWIKAIPGELDLGASDSAALKESSWEIIELNGQTGATSIFKQGIGYGSYSNTLKVLEEQGVTEKQIAWSGPMNSKTKLRFGVN